MNECSLFSCPHQDLSTLCAPLLKPRSHSGRANANEVSPRAVPVVHLHKATVRPCQNSISKHWTFEIRPRRMNAVDGSDTLEQRGVPEVT